MGRSSILIHPLLASIALVVVYYLFPLSDVDGGLTTPYSSEEIISHSESMLVDQGIDPSPFSASARLRVKRDAVRQLHERYGLEKGNEILRTIYPGYYWEIRWTQGEGVSVMVDGETVTENTPPVAGKEPTGDIILRYDMRGSLLSFQRTIPDSFSLPSIHPDSARALSRRFLLTYTSIASTLTDTSIDSLLSDSSPAPRRIELPTRTDFTSTYTVQDTVLDNPMRISYQVSGPLLKSASVLIDVPKSFRESTVKSIDSVYEGVLIVGIIIVIAVVSFKRFRAYEIGFRIATYVGILTAIAFIIKTTALLSNSGSGFEVIISLIVGGVFIGGASTILWAASETIIRENWKDKFTSIDLLARGFFTHSRLGQALTRGIALGIVSYSLLLVTTWVAGSADTIRVAFGNDEWYEFLSSDLPMLSVLSDSFISHIYTGAFFLMFFIPMIRRRLGPSLLVPIILIISLASLQMLRIEPLWAGFGISAVGSGVVVLAFVRYDLLTAFLALMVSTIAHQTSIMAMSGNSVLETSAVVVGVLFAIVMTIGVVAQIRRDTEVDLDAIAPSFSRRITERERLKHELAIARSVQMSFLPKTNPVITTLDIASRCAPALEVGGDYYDFVELPGKQLGVAVGDVSGKGTQAAFFMTLTKGFLRALARISHSPGAVLTEVNRLFYENVDRGVFISLIYGIFDTTNSRLTIARAGHNPVILRKSVKRNTQVLDPMGLALGLDKGDIFEQSIKEVSVTYEKGDVFVFYTDGISEAMNRTREEYGEARLSSSIEAHAHASAGEILEGVLRDMHTFVGKAEQHDDVTLVVVKIN